MREIKFRGKREEDGNWVYGNLIFNDVIVGKLVEFCDEYYNTEFWCEVHLETVGQYIGLKDKNGNEIYEGDVILEVTLDDEDSVYEVVWRQDDCSWIFRNRDYDWFHSLDIRFENCKVIGNIFENPKLMEG